MKLGCLTYNNDFEEERFVSQMYSANMSMIFFSNVHTSIHTRSQVKLSIGPECSQMVDVIVTFGNDLNMMELNSSPE